MKTEPIYDIRLQCVVCGTRSQRNRKDGNPPFGDNPEPSTITACAVCTSAAGYPDEDVKTLHFIDYATEQQDPTDP